MSAPAWLLDAIHATESACVPTVLNPLNQPWEQMVSPETHINKGVEINVPNVPTVPKEIGLPQDAGYVHANGSSSIRDSKPASHAELQRERRRAKVMDMLEAAPGKERAIYADTDSDSHNVILTIAVRACQQTCEMLISKDKYDAFRLMELIERLGAQNVH